MSLLCNRLFIGTSRLFTNNFVLPQDSVLTSVRCFSAFRKSKKGIFKLGLVGITVGALVGTGYSIHQLNKPTAHILNEQIKIPLLQNVPKIQPSRKVSLHKVIFGLSTSNSCTFAGSCTWRSIWFKISAISISNMSVLL